MSGITGETIWMDGEWVDWDAAQVHVLTHTLHYGLGGFAGIRRYATDEHVTVIAAQHLPMAFQRTSGVCGA